MKPLIPIIVLAACGTAASAQNAPSKPEAPAELSTTEKIAISAVRREVDQTDQDIMALRIDIARAHPGYNLNIQRGADWTLETIPKPPTVPVKPVAPMKPPAPAKK